ncbi:MAG: hypothetical protein GXP56_11675 [Deltaproteobacteria bacterium]|nr:hypothetical protein [Deltaproteobacteria bacterium]
MKMLDEIIKRVRNLTPDQQEEILETLKAWQTGKEREYQRLKTRTDVDVVVGDRIIQTDTNDISASGIYINTSGKFETNKSVRVVFSVPGIDKPFKLQGMIVRVEQNGMAIKFENITPYFKQILDDVIWENKNTDSDFS